MLEAERGRIELTIDDMKTTRLGAPKQDVMMDFRLPASIRPTEKLSTSAGER